MSVERTTADLVAALNGKDIMRKWHVLVAYHEDDLNKLLATRHEELQKTAPLTKVDQFKQLYQDPFGGPSRDVFYDLTLGTPSMSFADGKGSVVLKYAIAGTFKSPETGPAQDIPPSLFLKCVTDLKHVQGSLAAAGDKPKLQNPDEIVSFEDGTVKESHVVIDLLNPVVTVMDANNDEAIAFNSLVRGNLATHIRKYGIQYHLSTISSDQGANPPKSQLIPSRFVITSVPATGGERSSLLMWIGVKGLSCAGEASTVNSPLLFAPDAINQINPIPREKGASIYIAKDVVYSLFIKAGLESANFTNVSLVSSGDFQVTANPPSSSVTVPRWMPDGNSDKQGSRVCESFTFDMKDFSATFKLSNTGSTLSMAHTVNNVEFWKVNIDIVGPMFLERRHDETGHANLKLSAESSASWQNVGEAEKLSLDVKAPTSFKSVAENIDKPNWFQKAFDHHLDGILPGMDNVTFPLAEVKMDFGAIDYFLTTNILLPGSHVFKPGKAATDVYVPHDLVILGSI